MKISENARFAVERLNENGFEAFCVGGCVRDMLLGVEPNDWDVTTSALPDEIIEAFEGEKIVTNGLKHGTVTVILDGSPIEITTYRIDGEYADNRHPESVTFTKSLREDLARRDFTVNAMAYHPKYGVQDFFGGKADLDAGIIRCVGEPEKRFTEDGLRIMRALRFASVYGFGIDEKTSAAIHDKRRLLENISAERLLSEMTKLLCGEPRDILLRYADVFTVFIPELAPMFGFDQKSRYHIYDVWEHTVEVVRHTRPDPVMRWTALLHDIGKPHCFTVSDDGQGHFFGHAGISAEIAENITKRLRFDRETADAVILLIKRHCDAIPIDRPHIRRLMSKLGTDTARKLIELGIADNFGQSPELRYRQDGFAEAIRLMDDIERENDVLTVKDLSVDGNDMMALGLKGREIGDTLSKILEAVIDEKTENRKDAILRYYDENLKG